MKNILYRENIKLFFITALFSFVFFLLAYINNLLLSSVLAFVVYYLFSPLVDLCQRRGLNRSFSIFAIFVITTVILAIAFAIFIPLAIDQTVVLEKELPQLQAGFIRLLEQIEARFEGLLHLQEVSLVSTVGEWMIDRSTHLSSRLPAWISDSLTTSFLTPFLAFFMLRDGAKIKKSALQMVPNSIFEVSMNLIHQMNYQIGNFIRARLAEALIVGIVTWLGLVIIGFPYAVLLSVFAAATNLIPYIGPIVGAVPPVIILLVNADIVFGSIGVNLFAVSVVYLTAQALDAFIIIPMVVAKIVNLHPVTVILVIILGAQVLGIVGMIISIPVASLIKLFLTTLYQHTMRAYPQ